MPVCVNGSGVLLYFGQFNKRDGKEWLCPSFSRHNAAVAVNREMLQVVKYAALTPGEQEWYLKQLEGDISQRLSCNVASLFTHDGRVMMRERDNMLRDPAAVDALLDNFVATIGAAPANLNAANNTALMLVAMLRRKMAQEGGLRGWQAAYEARVKALCQQCKLKSSTILRYRKAGEVMLQSKVLSCMLPSFIAVHMEPIVELLKRPAVLARWDDLFAENMESLKQASDAPASPEHSSGDSTKDVHRHGVEENMLMGSQLPVEMTFGDICWSPRCKCWLDFDIAHVGVLRCCANSVASRTAKGDVSAYCGAFDQSSVNFE